MQRAVQLSQRVEDGRGVRTQRVIGKDTEYSETVGRG